MKTDKQHEVARTESSSIEAMVKNSCMCKLRESCPDKHAKEFLRERNLYAEFMLAGKSH